MRHRTSTEPGPDAPIAPQVSVEREALVREQFNSLTRLVPIVYLTVLSNILVLCWAYWELVPAAVRLCLLPAIAILILNRLVFWVRLRGQAQTLDLTRISRAMRTTAILGPALSLGLCGIGVWLMPYADSLQQSVAIITIWVTAAASSFCLFALPFTASMILAVSTVPLCFAFWFSGRPTLTVLPWCFAAVSALMIHIVRENFLTFAEIVNSRTESARLHREAEIAKESAIRVANADPLTDVANRRCFYRLLDDALAERARPDSAAKGRLAVAILDLDGFKSINDVHGHRAGDRLLIEVCGRLNDTLGGTGVLARMGGDEFAVLFDGAETVEEILAHCHRLIEAIDAPFARDSAVKHVHATCGLAIHGAGDDTGGLVERADFALYEAKARARGTVALFTPALEVKARERSLIEHGLSVAIDEDALDVFFQPIVDMQTGAIVGYEALARWTHPILGEVSPAAFIPIAEQIGLIGPLTDRLLRKAAGVAAQWPEPVFLSFNLSAGELAKPSAGLDVIAILAECGLAPRRFEVEITESAFMGDVEASRRTILNLKRAGIRVSLDDFGTGYSCFSHLRDLPLDKLKIDKSFVDLMCQDPKARDLVRAIIGVCADLELDCVAEGIEHPDQMASLKQLGCTFGQGYLISRPLPRPAFEGRPDPLPALAPAA